MNETIDLGKFPKGINNVAPDTDLPEGSLVSAVNVDIDKEGNVISRKGYTKVYSGNNIHSLYKSYFVENSILKFFDGVDSFTIDSTLKPNRFLSWETLLDDDYYSDGENIKIVGKGLAGVSTPPNNPVLSSVSGMLVAGTYQVSIVYQNPETKEIGGALLASTIHLNDNSGILLSNIPVSPIGYDVLIFCSSQNGEALHYNETVVNGITTYIIINLSKLKRILNTQFMEPLPGGHIIRHFKGRLYIAKDNVLWFSEAFRYGLRKTNKDFFQFPSKITIVQPVEDGIYIVADKTYFLIGTEPKNIRQIIISSDRGIEGTGITVDGDSFNMESSIKVAYWFSNKGAVLGLPGGTLKQLTNKQLALEENLTQGSTLYKEIEGIKQLITNFSPGGSDSSFAFGATVTSQIIRNGVVLP